MLTRAVQRKSRSLKEYLLARPAVIVFFSSVTLSNQERDGIQHQFRNFNWGDDCSLLWNGVLSGKKQYSGIE